MMNTAVVEFGPIKKSATLCIQSCPSCLQFVGQVICLKYLIIL